MIAPPVRGLDAASAPIGLCLDRGYRGKQAPDVVAEHGMVAHVQARDEEIKARQFDPEWRARRWFVERVHSWINRFRGLLVRWSKKAENHTAFLHLACGLIVWRNIPREHLPR